MFCALVVFLQGKKGSEQITLAQTNCVAKRRKRLIIPLVSRFDNFPLHCVHFSTLGFSSQVFLSRQSIPPHSYPVQAVLSEDSGLLHLNPLLAGTNFQDLS